MAAMDSSTVTGPFASDAPSLVTDRYDFRTTPYLERLLQGRAHDDPLVLQFLPDRLELESLPYESSDPIGDQARSPLTGIVHRYPDRVLLKAAHACPVYCRFCFRREMVGSAGSPLQGSELAAAIDYIRARPQIWEVILTGGDPLTLSGRRLSDLLARLTSIPHVGVVRIHSRVPVVAPESIDGDRLQALTQQSPLYLAVHVNHPDELTDAAVAALTRLAAGGVTLVSQTVLLKGINDDVDVLEGLFRRLVRLRVRPYYLHHPDLAPGTAHFRVSLEVGQALMRALRGRVSGLCLPTYVLDLPGGFGKVPAEAGHVGEPRRGHLRQVRDNQGVCHDYPE